MMNDTQVTLTIIFFGSVLLALGIALYRASVASRKKEKRIE